MIIACIDAPSSANRPNFHEKCRRWLADPDPEVQYEVAPDLLLCVSATRLYLLKSSISLDIFAL